jgi:hypothetical protein
MGPVSEQVIESASYHPRCAEVEDEIVGSSSSSPVTAMTLQTVERYGSSYSESAEAKSAPAVGIP